jgi:ribosomal protein L7/L12
MNNRQFLAIIRSIDTLTQDERLKVLEEIAIASPTLLKSSINKVKPQAPKVTSFDLYLTNHNDKIGAIKRVRELTGMGLADSKAFVEGQTHPNYNASDPYLLLRGVSREKADEVVKMFNPVGTIQVVPAGKSAGQIDAHATYYRNNH